MGPRGGWTSDPGIPAGEHAARWQSLGLSMTRIRAGGPRHRLEEDVDRATVTTALQAVTWKGDPEGRVFLRRTRGNPVLRDPLSVLEWSEARAKGPKAGEQALLARAFVRDGLLDHRLAIDTPLVSVSYMEAEGYREIRTRDGREVRVPEKWAPFAQRYVLLDLDDIDLDGADEAELARAVRGVLRRDPELSGVCAVVRTGPRGVQAWAELREVRIEPRSWFARPEVRSWYRSLGERVLRAIRRAGGRGGVLDPSSCAAGRFGRRPGWRVLPDYGLFRSRLLLVERERAENRAPRVSYNRAEGKP